MSKSRFSTRQLATAGIIAAVYAVLTMFLPIPQYGGIQLRVAEAMTLLPFLFPEAIPGLAVGCFIANLQSPFVLDWIVGTAATLVAAIWVSKLKNKWLTPIPPVLCNAIFVGAEIAWLSTGDGAPFLTSFGLNALTVGAGELIACAVLGLPLLHWVSKSPALKPYITTLRTV